MENAIQKNLMSLAIHLLKALDRRSMRIAAAFRKAEVLSRAYLYELIAAARLVKSRYVEVVGGEFKLRGDWHLEQTAAIVL